MQIFFQTAVTGIVTGCLYALIALGYSMVYGVLKLLNFAHGDLYMVGAYIGYFVIGWFGGPLTLSIPVPLLIILMLLISALGVGLLRVAPRIAPLITALGVSFVLEDSVLLLFGGYERLYSAPSFIPFTEGIHVGGVNITIVQILIVGISIAMMIGLFVLVTRTLLGKSMRAVAADREAAEMLGVNVNRTIAWTFFIGSAMAGVAGVMSGLNAEPITNFVGFLAGLKAFTAAVVGGIGSIPGALVGGLVIGLSESFSSSYLSSQYSDLIVFGILIAVMLVRPQGVFGRPPLQKV